jgi:hypothetical protein
MSNNNTVVKIVSPSFLIGVWVSYASRVCVCVCVYRKRDDLRVKPIICFVTGKKKKKSTYFFFPVLRLVDDVKTFFFFYV